MRESSFDFPSSQSTRGATELYKRWLCSQAFVSCRYRQRIDMVNADQLTIQDYLDEDSDFYEEKLDTYIAVWNKVGSFMQRLLLIYSLLL